MTNEVLELSQAVLDCMAGAAQVRSALVTKIASLQEENDRLRKNAVDASSVRQLATALASHGVIDRFNEAYFNKSASDGNAGQALARLLSILPKRASKEASAAPSPFRVDAKGDAATAEQDSGRAYQARLAKLVKRA